MDSSEDDVALRDPRGLGQWLRGALIVFIVLIIPTAIISAAFLHISDGDPNYVPEDPILGMLVLGLLAAGVLTAVVFIACIVLTLRVTHRMIKNLEALRSSHIKIGAVWATASYFVPFANLFVPVQGVRQIWDGTFAALEGEPPKEPRGAIGWWWACWLLSNFCDNAASRLSGDGRFQTPRQPTAAELDSALVLMGASGVFNVAAALLMMSLFGKLISAQSALAQR